MWERFRCWPPSGQDLEDCVDDLDLQAVQGQEYQSDDWMRGLESTLAYVNGEMWEGRPLTGPVPGRNKKNQDQ